MKRAGLLLLALLPLAGCAGSPANPEPSTSATTWPDNQVISACDEHGNRLYTIRYYERRVLAVVGQDPTCREARP